MTPVEKKTALKTDLNASKFEDRAKNAKKAVKTITSEDVKDMQKEKIVVSTGSNAPKATSFKTHYECGCAVVWVNEERIKAKCIKHGVE